MSNRMLLAATVATVLALSACTGNSDDTAAGPATSPNATAGKTIASQTDATAAAVDAAHSAADVMFARMMIPHHQQAIEMSDTVLAKDDLPADVTALAVEIKAAQGPEMQQLGQWLEMWGESTGTQEDDGGGGDSVGEGHGGHDMGDGMGDGMGDDAVADNADAPEGMPMMEGMLSAQEMQDLSDAQGTVAARLFLEQMIAHHEGAIDMAEDEVSDGTYPPAVEMARTIIDTQQREIEQMRALIASM